MTRSLAAVGRSLEAAERKVVAASERRRALPAGSSRAKVTTANAKWAIACEARDRLLIELADLREAMAMELERRLSEREVIHGAG